MLIKFLAVLIAAQAAVAAPQVVIIGLQDGKPTTHVAIPFGAGESSRGTAFDDVRYSDLSGDAGKVFGNQPVAEGLKWKADLLADGGLSLKLANFKKVGVVVIDHKAHPVLNGNVLEVTVHVPANGATVTAYQGLDFRVVVVPEPEHAQAEAVRKQNAHGPAAAAGTEKSGATNLGGSAQPNAADAGKAKK